MTRLHLLPLQVWQLDLLDTYSVRAFAKAFVNKYSKLDVLVNNAGVSEPGITKVTANSETVESVLY
jgi:NAD(P)-dependent dehydrogenase (short-subunit alcohol dehydrogenase family)